VDGRENIYIRGSRTRHDRNPPLVPPSGRKNTVRKGGKTQCGGLSNRHGRSKCVPGKRDLVIPVGVGRNALPRWLWFVVKRVILRAFRPTYIDMVCGVRAGFKPALTRLGCIRVHAKLSPFPPACASTAGLPGNVPIRGHIPEFAAVDASGFRPKVYRHISSRLHLPYRSNVTSAWYKPPVHAAIRLIFPKITPFMRYH
jgi:hypothetical protein